MEPCFPLNCAWCGKPLPAAGNHRRAIPRMGGKRRLVHRNCASEVDRQLTLEDPSTGSWRRGVPGPKGKR